MNSRWIEGDEDEDGEIYDDVHYDDEEEEFADVEDLKDAYAAGWKAKQKAADTRKSRGYHQPKRSGSSKGRGKGKDRPLDDRKKKSKCASCKQFGHWHGDPECPNVRNGKDPPRQAGTSGTAGGRSSVHYSDSVENSPTGRRSGEEEPRGSRLHKVNWTLVNWTFRTDGWSLVDYESSESEEEVDEPILSYATGRAKAPDSSPEVLKKSVRLKTVLEALTASIEEEETQNRLKKKEYKAVREEEARLKGKGKGQDKRHDAGRRPMVTDLKVQE